MMPLIWSWVKVEYCLSKAFDYKHRLDGQSSPIERQSNTSLSTHTCKTWSHYEMLDLNTKIIEIGITLNLTKMSLSWGTVGGGLSDYNKKYEIQKRGVELDYNNLSRDVEKIKVFKDLQTLSNWTAVNWVDSSKLSELDQVHLACRTQRWKGRREWRGRWETVKNGEKRW